jgi:hypothetical protein
MSFRSVIHSLNSPPLVAGTGAAILAAGTFVPVGSLSLVGLQFANVIAFAVNCAAVSVPGRIDGQQDSNMRSGNLNPSKPATNQPTTGGTSETSRLTGKSQSETRTYYEIYSPARGRTLVSPSGWAFAIWAPIYLGEAAFCVGQFFQPISTVLPSITAPFVAANLLQSLWCCAFRPSYNDGWHKYVSVGLLAGTGVALSQVRAVTAIMQRAAFFSYLSPVTGTYSDCGHS